MAAETETTMKLSELLSLLERAGLIQVTSLGDLTVYWESMDLTSEWRLKIQMPSEAKPLLTDLLPKKNELSMSGVADHQW